MPAATLRSWTRGRSYPGPAGQERRSEPLIDLPTEEAWLSFNNLIEAHGLAAIRRAHKVPMERIREALDYAQRNLKIQRLLLSEDLLAGQKNLFLEHLGDLINLSRSGQLAMRRVLKNYLERVERDEGGMPVRFYPSLGLPAVESKKIVIDPRLSYGRPVVARTGVSTSVLSERLDAGETPAEIAEDYGLAEEDVEDAILFEGLAA